MVKSVRTTESTKRYTFQSFRERVDSIKIEPSKNLRTRAFDETDNSHFLASIDRWVEFNRTGTFTQFVFDVRDIAQSLPQIIYFKEKIFNILSTAIFKKESISLQPLLEILTQFCHDLGPDFMEFYEPTINMITQLALGENDANTLEWEFNALAFIFKYLSKTLSQDLLPTFQLLEPLLKTKGYTARFCSEALSFLIRKTNLNQLSIFTNFAFDRIENDVNFQKSFVILFSEALKSTKGSIHSKSKVILNSLIDKINNDESSAVLADILISIISYGNQENVDEIYELILEKISSKIQSDASFLNHYVKILISLIFVDSGKKIIDWSPVFNSVNYILLNFPPENLSFDSKNFLIYLFTILIRNGDIKELTKLHNNLFKYSISFDELFLPFIISINNISTEKSLKFTPRYVQNYINNKWENYSKEIGLFIKELNDKNLLSFNDDPRKFKIILPETLTNKVFNDLENFEINGSNDLYEIYWRLNLLDTSLKNFNSDSLIKLFEKIKLFNEISGFKNLILSMIISLLVNNESPIKVLILENFNLLSSQHKFLNSVNRFVKANKGTFENPSPYIQIISNNLISSNPTLREESLQLINTLATDVDEKIVNISNQASIIESLQLDFSVSRDVGIRLRAYTSIIKNLDTKDDLRSEIYFKSLFGFLTKKFSPIWDSVFEVLPTVSHKNEKIIWDLAYSFITHQVEKNNIEFFKFLNDEEEIYRTKWSIIEPRLETTVSSISTVIKTYLDSKNTVLSSAELKFGSQEYPEFITTNALKALKTVPYIAEKNSSEFVELILDNDIEDEDIKTKFTRKENSLIFEILTAFKKLRKIPHSEELRVQLLNSLSSKYTDRRKVALDVLFNYNNNTINKYKDNLSNLLDDAIFRDELSKIFSKSGDSNIEDSDLDEVMPIVLRILFGRAKTNSSGGNKKGLKVSSIHILTSMNSKYVAQFLDIISERVSDDDSEINLDEIDESQITFEHLRICSSYVKLLSEVIKTLGEQYVDVLPIILKPLLLSIIESQTVINSEDQYDESLVTTAKTVRKSGLKDLSMLFDLLRDFNWDEYLEVIYEKILTPRFKTFEFENLQETSSTLSILVCWSKFQQYYELLLINDLEPAAKVLSLLFNSNTKQDVISTVFDFAINVINLIPKKKKFYKLQALVAEKVFSSLDAIFDRINDLELTTKAIGLLLGLVENKHVKDQERRLLLVALATKLLNKPPFQITKASKILVLKTLKALIDDFEGDFEGIQHLYEVSSKFLKEFTDDKQREELVELFVSIGEKFEEYIKAASLIQELNSFSRKRLTDIDFERRLNASREINDDLYTKLTALEWLPILNNSLYVVLNLEDTAIRASSSYSLRRFIDAFSSKEVEDKVFIRYFKTILLPALRSGLRNSNEDIQNEFISSLSHIVGHVKFIDNFEDMKVLFFEDDDEVNFFTDINSIQISLRQGAIKSLVSVCDQISGSNITHYILPIIENIAYCKNEKMRNCANDAIDAIESLVSNVSYKQFLAIFRRYLAGTKESTTLRDSVYLIVSISKSLQNNILNEDSKMIDLPEDKLLLDIQIEKEMIEPISKILNTRNDNTILNRVPLIQSLGSLCLCLSHDRIVSILPGILTKICHMLRSRHDDLREGTRKHLSKASNILGAKYIKFIIQELKGALGRGFQVHVLGYTVNSILISTELEHGDLDDSASLIMDIIMDNLFGSVSQEKEADGYRTTMKEVKSNKSFDTAEILSSLISLSNFADIINPIKLLLKERITYKIQTKLDELLRKICEGIYKNQELNSKSMLILCFEIFQESENYSKFMQRRKEIIKDEKEEHFLVQLNSKPLKVENENSIYIDTFQKLSLELLRSTLKKIPEFVTLSNLEGFLPIFKKSLTSENEQVLISVLKVLVNCVYLEFKEDEDIFQISSQKCLDIIQDYPSTESEVVQTSFKFLSTIIRQRKELSLKESSIGYLLTRIQPDMTEQSKQGLAFNFLKSIISKHIMLPEVYDTMDKIREVMVTSHAKERRDASRAIYFQFLMEYDQSHGRLEKQFKFLVDNLQYPSEEGKQSVMELINLILNKSGPKLLEILSSSFFVGLSKILISETEPKTRKMSITLITVIFEKMGTKSFEKYIIGWMNAHNSSLLKCSLQLYRIKLKIDGVSNDDIDVEVLKNIKEILNKSKSESTIEISWELIYTGLNCLLTIVEKDNKFIDEEFKELIISTLLYPHSWIRLISDKIMINLVKDGKLTDIEIQTVSNRLIHQLRVPNIEESLSAECVKFLTVCMMTWERSEIKFDKTLVIKEEEEEEKEEGDTEEEEELMTDWAVKRIGSIIKNEKMSKTTIKSCIQFYGMSLQILEESRALRLSEVMMNSIFNLLELKESELKELSNELLKMIENKIGISDFTEIYNKVRTEIYEKREDRKVKRSRLMISAPEVIAKRKIKKHEKERKRKREDTKRMNKRSKY